MEELSCPDAAKLLGSQAELLHPPKPLLLLASMALLVGANILIAP